MGMKNSLLGMVHSNNRYEQKGNNREPKETTFSYVTAIKVGIKTYGAPYSVIHQWQRHWDKVCSYRQKHQEEILEFRLTLNLA